MRNKNLILLILTFGFLANVGSLRTASTGLPPAEEEKSFDPRDRPQYSDFNPRPVVPTAPAAVGNDSQPDAQQPQVAEDPPAASPEAEGAAGDENPAASDAGSKSDDNNSGDESEETKEQGRDDVDGQADEDVPQTAASVGRTRAALGACGRALGFLWGGARTVATGIRRTVWSSYKTVALEDFPPSLLTS